MGIFCAIIEPPTAGLSNDLGQRNACAPDAFRCGMGRKTETMGCRESVCRLTPNRSRSWQALRHHTKHRPCRAAHERGNPRREEDHDDHPSYRLRGMTGLHLCASSRSGKYLYEAGIMCLLLLFEGCSSFADPCDSIVSLIGRLDTRDLSPAATRSAYLR